MRRTHAARTGPGPLTGARSGAALIVVLWLIVVLGTVASSVLLSTRAAATAAANYRAGIVGRYAAESGVVLAIATLEERLRAETQPEQRRAWLNDLDRALAGREQGELGDAHYAVALIDVGARVDINHADATALAALFSHFTDAGEAARAAAAIRAYVAGDPTEQPSVSILARTLRSLDELADVPGLPPGLVERAVPFLTVDGDGTINRRTAGDTVRAAAAGELRDEPSRILVVSRGWLQGQPVTHEIQAVYAVSGDRLILVRWRERET